MQTYGIGELVKLVYKSDEEQLVRNYSTKNYCKSQEREKALAKKNTEDVCMTQPEIFSVYNYMMIVRL